MAMQGLPQRNLHQFNLWKVASSRMLVLQDQEWLQIWKSALMGFARWKNSLARSKKNVDKSSDALLISTRQLGCVFQEMEPPKSSSILRKSWDIRKAIRCVRFTQAVVRQATVRDQKTIAWSKLPKWSSSALPQSPKFEDRSQEETEWQVQGAREAAWKLAKSIQIKGARRCNILLTFGELVPSCAIKSENWGKRIFCRFRNVDAHDHQKGLEIWWNGHFDDVEKSNHSHDSQWRSADAWRGNSVCQRVGYFLDHESPRKHTSSIVAWKALRWTRILILMDQWSKTTSIQNCIRIQCNTENFVPIVVPGLSTSSSSNLPSSTSMTPSRQEIDHPTSSSTSSTSPPMTSSTVSSDSVDGQDLGTHTIEITIPQSCQVNMLQGKNGVTCWPSQPKNPKPN